MEHEGHRDTVYHRFVSVCERVRVHERVYLYCLFCEKEPNLLASVCGLGSGGAFIFVSICIFLPAKSTFISSTNIDAENTS